MFYFNTKFSLYNQFYGKLKNIITTYYTHYMSWEWLQSLKELLWSEDTSCDDFEVKTLEKHVKFDKIVRVILIPSRHEYGSVKHDLWG